MESKKTKVPSCLIRGPGPKYGLPSLTGYYRHDPTKKVQPAYTIPKRKPEIYYSDIPGPNKYDLHNKTNRGVLRAPAYTLGFRNPDIIKDSGPSPAEYKVDQAPLVNHHKAAPAYTIRNKFKDKIQSEGPGPNTLLPSCIGPNIPDKKAQAAYTMAFSKPKVEIPNIPGPAAYKKVDIELTKKRYPAYTMRFRRSSLKGDDIPGPKYNAQILSKRAPTFAFGIKHSQCAVLPMTPEDEL